MKSLWTPVHPLDRRDRGRHGRRSRDSRTNTTLHPPASNRCGRTSSAPARSASWWRATASRASFMSPCWQSTRRPAWHWTTRSSPSGWNGSGALPGAEREHPHRRLCQGGGRPDRRHPPDLAVLRGGHPDSHRHAVLVHPLRAQHRWWWLCSLVAVVWQLGLLQLLGYELDPYSVLVPFLVFAIGMSHGAQKMNGIMQDVGRGTHRSSPRATPSGACSWPG
jgi:hypothetical protein